MSAVGCGGVSVLSRGSLYVINRYEAEEAMIPHPLGAPLSSLQFGALVLGIVIVAIWRVHAVCAKMRPFREEPVLNTAAV